MSTTKSNGKNTSPTKTKVDPKFNISYINLRSLQINFPKLHLYWIKTESHFPVGTSLSLSISVQEFTIPTSLLLILIVKQNPQNYNKLSDCIKDGLPCSRDQKNEDLDLLFMCFNVTFIDSISFIFNVFTLQAMISPLKLN